MADFGHRRRHGRRRYPHCGREAPHPDHLSRRYAEREICTEARVISHHLRSLRFWIISDHAGVGGCGLKKEGRIKRMFAHPASD